MRGIVGAGVLLALVLVAPAQAQLLNGAVPTERDVLRALAQPPVPLPNAGPCTRTETVEYPNTWVSQGCTAGPVSIECSSWTYSYTWHTNKRSDCRYSTPVATFDCHDSGGSDELNESTRCRTTDGSGCEYTDVEPMDGTGGPGSSEFTCDAGGVKLITCRNEYESSAGVDDYFCSIRVAEQECRIYYTWNHALGLPSGIDVARSGCRE